MTVTAADFFDSADAGRKTGKEIDARNCVSRAYYGAFHAALVVADAHYPDAGAHLGGMGVHERLIGRFLASSELKAKSVGYLLRAMKSERVRADYETQINVTSGDADAAMANVEVLTQKLVLCIPKCEKDEGMSSQVN